MKQFFWGFSIAICFASCNSDQSSEVNASSASKVDEKMYLSSWSDSSPHRLTAGVRLRPKDAVGTLGNRIGESEGEKLARWKDMQMVSLVNTALTRLILKPLLCTGALAGNPNTT